MTELVEDVEVARADAAAYDVEFFKPGKIRRPDEFPVDQTIPACYQWPLPLIPPIPDGTPKRRRLFAVEVLRVWQDGRCALCGGRNDGFVQDHCHNTGLTRGFLCHTCNLGMDKGSGDPADRAYELRPATVVIGMAPQYRAKSNRWDRPQAWIERELGPCPVDDPIAAAPYLERALALIEAEHVESRARMGDVWREHWSVTEARREASEAAWLATIPIPAPPRGRVVSEYVVSKVGVRLRRPWESTWERCGGERRLGVPDGSRPGRVR